MSKYLTTSRIVVFSLVVLCASYLYFLYLPTKRNINELRADLAAKEQFVNASRTLGQQIYETEKEIQETLKYVDAWRQTIPDTAEMPQVFGEITRRAKSAGVTTSSFNPLPVKPMASLQQVPLNLEAAGEFSNVFEMVSSLEALPAAFWIKSLRLEANRKPTSGLRSELNLVIFADKPVDSD